jgi:uncharacterized coiled-coil protein SlyX
MDIDMPTGTVSIYDMQVATLEAGLAEVKMQSEKIEKDLAKHFEDMAKLDAQFKTAMIVMQGRDLVNICPRIDRLQMAILKDMEAHDHLRAKVTELRQQMAPVEDRLQTLFSKVGGNND